MRFQISYNEINFNCDTLQCTVGDETVYIKLQEEENINKENNIETQTKETFAWSDASTKLFLTLYKEKKELLTTRKIKTKKILWESISEIMQSHGYNVTVIQVENKYKSLERSYKNMITNNKQTGRGRTSCPYET